MLEKASFSTLLKHYRQAAGLTQETLAVRAGLSTRAISNLERGINRAPRFDTLELLSSALSLSSRQQALLQAAARPSIPPPYEASLGVRLPGLPLPPTRLVGREQERTRALTLLRNGDTHLLTLTGPSGVGKTRLALQVAWDLTSDFTDGVIYVPLAPIRDAVLVPGIVAQVIGLQEQIQSSFAEQVSLYLLQKHLLLVLDNMEQVPESAMFVSDLLESCPRLFVLVTSRTPLHLRAEQELTLSPLPLEDAVTLFCERAQAETPTGIYPMSDVAAICEQLDCLPLAIELAALRVKVLSLDELLRRLTHRLALLRGGAKDLPPRQQSMEDSIAWSYELLTPQQQCCFRALGVFMGGWTLEAAEAVCWDEAEFATDESILTLTALIDASLIQTEMPTGEPVRFGMLELIREYARKQLHMAGEEEQCRRRHAAYYASLAESVVAYFGPEPGKRDPDFLKGLEKESPNARAALQWADEKQDAELGLRLTGFGRLWHVRGQMSETIQWTERMLALDLQARNQGKPTAPLTLRIAKLYGIGRTLVSQGKVEQGAETAVQEALQLAESIDDQKGISNAYETLGMIAQTRGKFDEAATAFMESYTHSKQIDYRGQIGRALVHLADISRMKGDVTRATILAKEALADAQTTGVTWDIPIILTLLGQLAYQEQNYAGAKAHYRQALALYRTFSTPTYTATCLENLAAVICAEGQYTQATRLCAAAVTLREQAQTPLPPVEHEAFERVIAKSRTALDREVFEQEWMKGARLTQLGAIDDALSD
jgi:predicted ATPase/transcriptional regulator with XRE-family HTH domain